jgi:uncharacterized protein (TIGR02996 family)
MDEAAALWQAIHEAPADEGAWLVMADWLEEHDSPERAELFRVTLELRRGGARPRRRALEARKQELLAAGVRPCVPEVVNSIGMRFVLVPPGTFRMGAPRRATGAVQPFYLGVFPVTQRQFQQVMRRNPSHFRPKGSGKDRVKGVDTGALPVDSVIYPEATGFCDKLSALPEEKKAGRAYRLPTEIEWVYACRAASPTATAFHCGKALPEAQANTGTRLGRTSAVGSYPPNAFGLFDMHGNVAEFCLDWRSMGHSRALRGGAWSYGVEYCRTAYRDAIMPTGRNNVVGFRAAFVLAGA